ncbi:dihydroorotate dehydrogenase [Hypoxylon texense]
MKATVFRFALLAAAASSVVAQDDTTTTSTTDSSDSGTACAAQNILDTCLQTTESYVSLCATTDYMCLCDKYVAIMTCFNNCPNDSREASYQQQKDLYCMNASLYATTSGNRTVSRSITTTSSSAVTTTSEKAVKTSDVASAASTPTATESAQAESGADERLGTTGSLLAAMAGLFAALL